MIRECDICQAAMEPVFASDCEDPVGYRCATHGIKLESGGRMLSPEERARLEPVLRDLQRPRRKDPRAARIQGEALARIVGRIPVDVESLAEGVGVAIRWAPLPLAQRGRTGRTPDGRPLIILNETLWQQWTPEQARWIAGEELAHILLEHETLVASDTPGAVHVDWRTPERRAEESEARALAEGLLMPEEEVRRRAERWRAYRAGCFGASEFKQQKEAMLQGLAREFGVSQTAMGIRLKQLSIL
ncbi:MAG: ImmA/IrrE family metallo-endopeptidase [Armatimonadetes bacterium]|nr:ImmA/IrrE family metallo-endopeptidase [Armatimonadota bacterium]